MSRSNDNALPDIASRSTRRTFLRALGVAAASWIVPGRPVLHAMLRDNHVEAIHHSTFVMGQIANITIIHSDAEHARGAVTMAFDELRRLEALMSVFDERSQLSAINRHAGRQAVHVADEVREVIARSAEIAGSSNGGLDITIDPLMRLWGFRGPKRTGRPSDRQIAAVLDSVGAGHIAIEGGAVGLKKEGAALDLGGVAVGYALDRVASLLRAQGISSALLELSGDYYAVGAPPESAKGWEIGIQHPTRRNAVAATRFIRDEGLSTSANYANVLVYHARRYGHILDPHSGNPAGRIRSATVIAPTGFLADAYSTALFVAGDHSILPQGSRGLIL